VIGDVMYYWVGRNGVTRLAGLGRWFGVNAAVPQGLQRDLRDNATRMLLVGKWTHSVGFAVLVGSGMLRLPLARFILVNLLASVPKSGVLLGLGYFAGDHLAFFESHLVSVAIVLCAVGVAAIGLILRRADAMRAGQ
jgi:membrane-associated protein